MACGLTVGFTDVLLSAISSWRENRPQSDQNRRPNIAWLCPTCSSKNITWSLRISNGAIKLFYISFFALSTNIKAWTLFSNVRIQPVSTAKDDIT